MTSRCATLSRSCVVVRVRDRGSDSLRVAHAEGWALGAFSTYNLEFTQGIVRAAEEADSPVIVAAGASAFAHAGLHELAAQALLAADLAKTPVGVHLDHSRDLSQIQACLAAGYTSVMVDGSHLPFEDNVTLTSSAVEAARPYGAWVEGELGAVAGDEDRSEWTSSAELTDVARAEEFAHRTGVDALAVAVGNVHGTASGAPVLDMDLLASLHAVVPVPLVLHGASGLSDAELAAVRRRGVAKVNVNTELRAAFLRAMSQALSDVTATADVARALQLARDAVASVVRHKIRALSSPADATGASERGS